VAAPIFAPAFYGMKKIEPLLALLGKDPDKKFEAASQGKKLELLRQELAEHALDNIVDHQIKKNGPLTTAKHLQGIAKTWGVKLPENWLELAQPFLEGLKEYEGLDGKTVIVSAETEAAK
jgi:IS5 family transposase